MKKLIIIFLLLLIPSISYADLTLTEGTAIDLSSAGAGADVTVDVDTTEVEATTWGAGGNASNLWTFDVSGTDTTMLLGNGTVSFSGTAIANAFTGDLTGAVTGAASGNLLNSASDTMVGTLTADGFTIGANKIITLGSNTVMHNGTDFVFDDKVTSTGLVIGSADVTEAELEILDGATLTTTELNYVDGVTSAIQTQIETKGVGDLLADGSIPLTANWDVGSFTVTAGGFALAQDEFLTLGSNTVIHNGTDFNFDDTILWSGGGSANADIGYTHSQDNTQAHTDYLLNSGNDTSAGTISAAGFNSTSTIATYGTNTVDFDTTDNYVLTFDDASKSWRGEVAGSGAGDLKADGSVPLTDNWDVGSYTITAGGFAVAQGEFATYGANTVHHDGTDFKFDDTITWSGGTSANADIGYTHSQDNSQAHTDYLLNSGNDTTSGTLTSTGFIIGSASVDEAELEILDGATLNTTDINIIDGVGDSGSLTATELLYVDGVTSAIQTQLENTGSGDLKADGTVPLTDNWDVGSYTITAGGFAVGSGELYNYGSTSIAFSGTDNYVLTYDSSIDGWGAEVASGGSAGFNFVGRPHQAHLSTINFMGINGGDADTIKWSGLLDDTTDEAGYWESFLRPYASGGFNVGINYSMATATTGTVIFGFDVMCVSDGEAIDVSGFGTTNTVNDTVPGTAGLMGSATMSAINEDSCAQDDMIILKLYRDADAALDNASGDAELRNFVFYE